MLVILETMFDRKSGHPDVNARLRGIALRIKAQNGPVLQDRRIEQNHVDAVMKFLLFRHFELFSIFLPVGQPMSDRDNYLPPMTKHHGLNRRLAVRLNIRGQSRRIPRGLALLRALRLRLAAEGRPHLFQAEFRF